jgi:hypothetical protein
VWYSWANKGALSFFISDHRFLVCRLGCLDAAHYHCLCKSTFDSTGSLENHINDCANRVKRTSSRKTSKAFQRRLPDSEHCIHGVKKRKRLKAHQGGLKKLTESEHANSNAALENKGMAGI